MIFFITVLRALAACLITNAHYTGIYPSDIIANGGLIGDIIFFAVSGYCLSNIKDKCSVKGFLHWYGKRLWRIYPPVVLCTIVYSLLGLYNIAGRGFFWWFVYPTKYHFIGSIVVLYIPFFFIMKIKKPQENLVKIMLMIAVAWLFVYIFIYDKRYYHIDSVYEPMIRFLFMESMLLGAWFRFNDSKLRNNTKVIYPICIVTLFIVYFASKVTFSVYAQLSSFQFLNQIFIFALLYFLLRFFSGIDNKLEKMPERIKKVIETISSITLEIYVVQYVIIDIVKMTGLMFPVNWIVLTFCIIGGAFILHFCCGLIYNSIGSCSVCR